MRIVSLISRAIIQRERSVLFQTRLLASSSSSGSGSDSSATPPVKDPQVVAEHVLTSETAPPIIETPHGLLDADARITSTGVLLPKDSQTKMEDVEESLHHMKDEREDKKIRDEKKKQDEKKKPDAEKQRENEKADKDRKTQRFQKPSAEEAQQSGRKARASRGQFMGAWELTDYGGVDSLRFNEQVRIPRLRDPLDIVVEVHAASINPFDIERSKGYGNNAVKNMGRVFSFPYMMRLPFTRQQNPMPTILGRDFSGVVVDVGKLVRGVTIGQEVYGVVGPHRHGTFAEYTATSGYFVAEKPLTVSHAEAASLPYVACTAWTTLKLIENLPKVSQAGTRVLVIGSGGVGSFVIQYLRALGIHVTAVCSSDRVDFVQQLGADEVIDYQTSDVEDELRQRDRYDVILEASGGDYEYTRRYLKGNLRSFYVTLNYPLLDNMDNYGTMAGLAKSGFDFWRQYMRNIVRGSHTQWAIFTPNGSFLQQVKEMVDGNQIRPAVDKVFKFDQLPEACRYMESGEAKGKVVVQIKE